MAGRIIYLEVDDEITSAAARIRDAQAPRIAVVLPYGSRVATSRINFRLLSRDAMTHDKRLSIVSGDAATRALAASAGLPVFASVAEYESSLEGMDDGPSGTAGPPVAAAVAGALATPDRGTPSQPIGSATGSDGTLGLVVPAAVGGAVLAGGAAVVPPADTIRTSVPRHPSVPTAVGAGTAAGPRRGGRNRTAWMVGAAILALAVLVAGVGIYLLLPSAAIGVTPRQEPVGPVDLTVTADTTATEPDAAALVVPAQQVPVPVSVTDTFNATGKRVALTSATGTVRFQNLDPTGTNRIAAGSVVRTNSGIRFRTDATVTVPRAQLITIGTQITLTPGRISVAITAVEGGPDGNVAAGTIVIVPNGENSLFLKVSNPEPTSGGTRQEFTRVTQADVDGALAALDASLHEAFTEAMADPALASGGATVFPETGVLGPTTPSVDPATLVGQEVATFDLGLSADGTVVTADSAPVSGIAMTALQAAVKPDHQLVPGSADVSVGGAIVNGQTVTFPVHATAKQTADLDPAALEKMVLGKPIPEAKAILAPFGDVDISVSPDWTGSVPSFESRVDVTVHQPVQIESPPPSPTGSTTP
ncbi:MAG TPA: baseplate J/gp47 family protein [Candidatus Limnocylindrales bacterium]|nr:baseplate J/gp47 family protein [Candidatus Limnocylindrales bacterium]